MGNNTTKVDEKCGSCQICKTIIVSDGKIYTILLPSKVTAICKVCDVKRGETFATIQKYKYEEQPVYFYRDDRFMYECEICKFQKKYRRHITYSEIKVCQKCHENHNNPIKIEKLFRQFPSKFCEVCKTNNPGGKYSLMDVQSMNICSLCAVANGATHENLKDFVNRGTCKACGNDNYLINKTNMASRVDMCQQCWINYNKV